MRIGLDVMGGDHAPNAVLDGAAAAIDSLDPADSLVLFGDERLIREHLEQAGVTAGAIEVVATTETIDMNESPVEAVRTKNGSSLVALARGAGRKAEQPLDAIISAGNTGACVAAAQMFMRRLPSVHRPGIAVSVPTFSGPVILIDVGANIEPKPHHLAQYGVMGAVFARRVVGIENPRIAIMNVGGEEQKGTTDMKEAREILLRDEKANFTGYIEGRDVFEGVADVIVTDGVVGNVMLKLAEGLSAGIFKALKHELISRDPELAMRLQPIVKELYRKHDYHEYGGAPLLGVNGICLISHGSSEARTIHAAVRTAKQIANTGVNQAIVERLTAMELSLQTTPAAASTSP